MVMHQQGRVEAQRGSSRPDSLAVEAQKKSPTLDQRQSDVKISRSLLIDAVSTNA